MGTVFGPKYIGSGLRVNSKLGCSEHARIRERDGQSLNFKNLNPAPQTGNTKS